MSFVPLKPRALRLGLYIKIEGSWFNHPFPTNSFKIKTAKELETLKALATINLFVDIDRSDPKRNTLLDPPDSSTVETIEDEDMKVEESVVEHDADTASPPESERTDEDTMQRKVARHEAFQAYQAHLRQVGNHMQEGPPGIQADGSGRGVGSSAWTPHGSKNRQ